MREEKILEILEDWNFWKRKLDTGVERREYLERAKTFLETDMVLAIMGIRRAGKSFIMRQVAKDLIANGMSPNETVIVNFEDSRFTDRSVHVLDQIFETYLQYLDPEHKPCILLDEIHLIDNWERWVRTTNELDKAKVIVSGSNAQLLSGELATVLTGRHLDLFVFPVCFEEFLRFRSLEINDKLDMIHKKIDIKRLLREYFEFGGFPQVVLSKKKKEILVSYFDDILNKDVIRRYNIRKIDELIYLAKFYLTNISSPVTFTSLEKVLNITADTIETFSSYLKNAFLIFFISKFSFSVKNQQKAPRKVYSIDVGLSNAVGFRFSKNIGKIAENIVAVELKRKQSRNLLTEIYYWKDYQQNEVDFVIKEGLKIKGLVQVCWDISSVETRKRETRALLKASKELKCNNLLIITGEYEDEEKVGNKKILYTPLWKWLLIDKIY